MNSPSWCIDTWEGIKESSASAYTAIRIAFPVEAGEVTGYTEEVEIDSDKMYYTHFFIKNLAQGLLLQVPYFETSFDHFVILKVP